MYFHYCYLLGAFPRQKKQNHKRLHFLLREDLIKLDAITQEARLLATHRIDTAQQLYRKQRTVTVKSDEAASAEVSTAISALSKELSELRKEVKLCNGIAVRSGVLLEHIQKVREENYSQRKEQTEHDQFRRCGRANR